MFAAGGTLWERRSTEPEVVSESADSVPEAASRSSQYAETRLESGETFELDPPCSKLHSSPSAAMLHAKRLNDVCVVYVHVSVLMIHQVQDVSPRRLALRLPLPWPPPAAREPASWPCCGRRLFRP